MTALARIDADSELSDSIDFLLANDSEIKSEILKNPDYRNTLLKSVILDELKADLSRMKALKGFDFATEKADFLERCKLRSMHTAKAYRYALNDFAGYTKSRNLETPFFCTPSIADDYLFDLQKRGKSPATVRQYCGALSAFFVGMERKSNYAIKNVFRGCKALPKKQATKRIENEIPTENLRLFKKDIMTIINAERVPEMKAMIYAMAFRGLRAGSFQNMSIHGGRFFTKSKGKEISGELPEICIKAIDSAGIKHNEPFAEWNSAKVSSMFQYHIGKLYVAGKISYRYSAHDLRHFYALTEYTRTKDIYNVSKLLGHASIAITEIYLRGLRVIE